MRRNVLNITASDVKDAKLTATVTIPAADVDAAIKKAYKDTAKKYRFPGFRAGKAPRPVIDSALGAEATLAQATNDLIAANEPAVLNELDIVPTKNGDYKELDLAKDHEDYTYTVEFSLRPAAELSSFDAVEIEMPPAEVTESEINNQVEMLLNYRATFEDVEGRAVEADDYVTVDLKAVENADNFAAEGRMLIAGSDSNPAEFNEALIGANVDDVKSVTWTDEVEEGEEAETHTVEVTVKGIKVRNTPELTDELVKSDFGFDSIEAMRDAIKIEIEQDKASRLPAEKENRCVSALAERLQLDEMDADYEQSVFEELGQNFLSNLAARGMTLDTWLPASGLTMEQFVGDLHKQANDVARESLALDALARELKIEVTVKGIKVRNTPELTDELVKSDFGFDSIDAMRDAIKLEIEQDKASRLPAEKENRCVAALAERLQLDEMDADYEQSVFEELGQNFLSNLAARGMTLDTWLPASGLTMEQFIGDLHKQANDVARESLALDALARELKIEVTEDDVNAEFEKAGVKDVEASKAEFIADGRMPAVRESIRRSKAVDHLVENAKVTEVDETAKDAE